MPTKRRQAYRHPHRGTDDRRHPDRDGSDHRQARGEKQKVTQLQGPPTAYVTAYEAQLERYEEGRGSAGMIKWAGEEMDVWAERYDIIHLLDSLPSIPSTSRDPQPRAGPSGPSARSRSPSVESSGWSDLPSDEEEVWALSDDEAREAYTREKRRKWVEDLREARVRERELEDAREGEGGQAQVQDDDEEPPKAIAALMSHTALSLARSPDPRLLEIRIMAHHASDERFAFLRGRWASTWADAKTEARVMFSAEKARERERAGKPVQTGLGGLMVGYGSDSGSEEEGGGGEPREPEVLPPSPPPPPPSPPVAGGRKASSPAPPPPHDQAPPPVPEDKDEAEAEARKQAERRARAAAWKLARSQGK